MRSLLGLLFVAFLSGCASSSTVVLLKRIDRNELAKQRSVKAFHAASNPLDVDLPSGEAGPVGPAVPGAATPAELKTALNADPAVILGKEFLSHLKTRHAIASVPRDVASASDEATKLRETPAGGSYLDFVVTEWRLSPLENQPTAFNIHFRAQAKLVRHNDRTTLWRADCRYPAKDEFGTTKPWDEVAYNHGEGFRGMMDEVIRDCGNQLIAMFVKSRD